MNAIYEKIVKKYRRRRLDFLKILAFVIPLIILLIVLYVNFLPFGYSKDYNIYVDNDGKVTSDSFGVYFEDLKGNKITNLSDVYSYSVFNLVVNPHVVLKNAKVSAGINGDDVYFVNIDFGFDNYSWDYFWDFTEGIPEPLNGTARYDVEKKCVYFNDSNNETLYYPNSEDMFENSRFIVYAKWMPENNNGINQQIMGHYNWELWQNNNDSVRFMIGRLENKTGLMPSISYAINSDDFFDKPHELLAVYSPDKDNGKGFIEFYVDHNFAGRNNINDKVIWVDYNADKDLSFGWSPHNYGNNSYFQGCIYEVSFDYGNIDYLNEINFTTSDKEIKIPITGTGDLNSVRVYLEKQYE